MHLSLGWTSEAEDWGKQHAAVCRERPLGSLSGHGWTGATGSTAADTDAAGGKQPLIKPTPTDWSVPDPAFHSFHSFHMHRILKEKTWCLCLAVVGRLNDGDTACHRGVFFSCFTLLLKSDWGACSPSCFTEGQSQTDALMGHSTVFNTTN